MSTDPIEHLDGAGEQRLTDRAQPLATGSLACPDCDAPVFPGGPLRPSDPLRCPYCLTGGPVRDFLTLGEPTRPARVVVRVVLPHALRG